MKAIPIGTNSFSKLVMNDYYFVDKTLMIKEFLERKSTVTLITRPRRFGKTINMSMMAEFFDITKDSKEIFKGTKIMETPYATEINQYPTIFISFADAKDNKMTVVNFIKNEIQKEYEKYMFVFKDLSLFEKNDFDHIVTGLLNKNNETLDDVSNALIFLMKKLKDYYGKEVMLFIDEYDTPFIESRVGNFYPEIKSGLSTLLRSSLKNSIDLKYAMLTGIQRVAKENIFSDLNNLIVCDITNQRYASYFGFDTQETKELLEYYHLELNEEVKEMYDGYKIGNKEIYNPWSILNYVDNKQLIPYWVNTSANTMIKQAITKANYDFKEEYEKLITNNYLETTVNLQTSFYEVENTPNLWGLFVSAGYLTADEVIDIEDNYYRIRIPNNEVKTEFKNLTEYYLSLNDGQLSKLARFLINEQLDEFSKEYQNILMLPSYHDLNNENSYHMMMLGMCICLSNNYKVISNREEGKGRCDIIIQAHDEKKTSFVIEFKYLKEDKKDVEKAMDKLSNEAIQQIKDRRYDYDLKGRVIYIGLAHHGKDVVMKWEER